MDRIDLKPGKYILTETVQNPKPDRRQKHDWRAKVEWAKGTLFYVVEHSDNFGTEEEPRHVTWNTVYPYGDYEHYYLPLRMPREADDTDCFKALKLTEKLKLVEEKKLGDVFNGPYSVEPHLEENLAPELIAILLDKGVISFEQLTAAVSDLHNQTDEQWDALRAKHGI